MRIPAGLLEHTVNIRPLSKRVSSAGSLHEPAIAAIPSLTVEKRTKVIDQRSDSETRGELIQVDAHVLVQADRWAPAGSLVTIWPGEPMERTGVVVSVALGRYSRAWESAQFWLV